MRGKKSIAKPSVKGAAAAKRLHRFVPSSKTGQPQSNRRTVGIELICP